MDPESQNERRETMATTDTVTTRRRPASLQELAKRHLWMHFTRMGSYDDARGADHRPRRGRLRLRRARQPLPRRPLGAVLRQRRPRPDRDRRGDGAPGRGARLRHHLELRASARDRARRADRLAGPGRPQPRLLHLRRLGGGRVGDQARARLPPAHRQPAQDQVPQPRGRLPRHHPRGAAGDRDHGSAHRLRAAGPGRDQGAEHQQLSLARRTATRSGPPTRSRRRSSSRGPRRSPR